MCHLSLNGGGVIRTYAEDNSKETRREETRCDLMVIRLDQITRGRGAGRVAVRRGGGVWFVVNPPPAWIHRLGSVQEPREVSHGQREPRDPCARNGGYRCDGVTRADSGVRDGAHVTLASLSIDANEQSGLSRIFKTGHE